jgi:hypothetical protein
MADFFGQWKYIVSTKGTEHRGFFTMAMILIPLLLLVGVASIVIWIGFPALGSTVTKITAVLCPIAAIGSFGGVYAMLML